MQLHLKESESPRSVVPLSGKIRGEDALYEPLKFVGSLLRSGWRLPDRVFRA